MVKCPNNIACFALYYSILVFIGFAPLLLPCCSPFSCLHVTYALDTTRIRCAYNRINNNVYKAIYAFSERTILSFAVLYAFNNIPPANTLQQVIVGCVDKCFRDIRHSQFRKYVLAVHFHSIYRPEHPICNFAHRISLCRQIEHRPLILCQFHRLFLTNPAVFIERIIHPVCRITDGGCYMPRTVVSRMRHHTKSQPDTSFRVFCKWCHLMVHQHRTLIYHKPEIARDCIRIVVLEAHLPV